MNGLLDVVFAGLWLVFGTDTTVPLQKNVQWEQTSAWHETAGAYVFEASSSVVPGLCAQNPEAFVDFPMVINGAHEIFLDGKLFLQFSDPSFKQVRSIYGKPSLKCKDVATASTIVWRASTDSKYFARFRAFPELEPTRPKDNFFNETLNVAAAATLVIMGFFCFIIFTGKVTGRLAFAYFLSNVFIATYFVTTVPTLFFLDSNMLLLHKVGDSSLGVGTVLLYFVLSLQGLISRRVFSIYAATSTAVFALQWLGRTGDEVQLGTNLTFLPAFVVLASALYNLVRKLGRKSFGRLAMLQLLGLAVVASASINDILVVSGVIDGYLLLSIGMIAQMIFLALGVHETILETFTERDFLRSNLEKEVQRKTAQLETAMHDLKQTQAELIHSAKLASLGTLSAGIAHEINNSVNFVNGAIPPLEKLINKLQGISERDYEVGRKLLAAIKDGIGITVEIVKSLRQFTGLNQAKLKDIRLVDVVHSVSTILGPRLKENCKIISDISEELTIYGDVVGINQILMNLVTNALDAMPNGGTITISAKHEGERTILEVRDTGMGIPEAIQTRIFDPFFTTKDVGVGTGLGLYIITNEIKKYNGLVELESSEGVGTTFRLSFPDHGVAASNAGDAA